MNARALAAGLAGLLAVGALGACGESKEDKAQNQVCDARADIQTQINTLKGLPLASTSLPKAQDALNSIAQDLKEIADVQSDLKGSRKEQAQAANATFAQEVKTATSAALKAGSTGDFGAAISSAAEGLASAYSKALAPIDC